MPGKRISELTALTGANTASNDDLLIFDTNTNETKRISRTQLAAGMVPDLPFLYFHGVLTSDPTQRPGGAALVVGDGYLRSSDMLFRYYTATGWKNYEQIAIAAATAQADRAEDEADRAEAARDDASAVAGIREFITFSNLLSNNTLTYTAGQPGTVTTGDVVRTRSEGFALEVVASGATDFHVQTAGGVKFYVLNQTSFTDALALRKPRKLWAKIFAAFSSAQRVVWVSAGDSLASRKIKQIISTLDRQIGGVDRSPGNPTGINIGGVAGSELFTTDLVSVTSVSNDHAISPRGAYFNIAAGGSLRFIAGGVNPLYTTIKVFFAKEPGAGTLALSVGGVVVDSESADNPTVTLGVLEHTVGATSTQNLTTIAVSGAAVKVLGGWFVREDLRGVVEFPFLAAGGITPSQMVQTANTQLIHQQLLQQAAPDIITLEMDDAFGDGGVNQAALDTMMGVWDTAAPYADKLLIGSTPRSAQDIIKLRANLRLRQVAKERGPAYLYFDSYTLMGSYADQVAIFGPDDGVHPNVAANAFAAEMLWDYLGLSSLNLGYTPRAVNSETRPSSLFRGTKLFGGIDELVFQTDATFGYDWDMTFNRSLTFKDKSGNVTARISNNTAVFPNVLPTTATFGVSGTTKYETYTSTDRNGLRLLNTSNPSGSAELRLQGGIYDGVAKANLPSASGVATGTIRFCTNARSDGAGCFVYRGTDGNWRRISDDVVV